MTREELIALIDAAKKAGFNVNEPDKSLNELTIDEFDALVHPDVSTGILRRRWMDRHRGTNIARNEQTQRQLEC